MLMRVRGHWGRDKRFPWQVRTSICSMEGNCPRQKKVRLGHSEIMLTGNRKLDRVAMSKSNAPKFISQFLELCLGCKWKLMKVCIQNPVAIAGIVWKGYLNPWQVLFKYDRLSPVSCWRNESSLKYSTPKK